MTIALRCRVKGRVQGVGFRYFTQRLANELKIYGWVRNRADGDVELHAQGDETIMQQFVRRLQSGPSMARVARVEELPVEPGDYHNFSIEL